MKFVCFRAGISLFFIAGLINVLQAQDVSLAGSPILPATDKTIAITEDMGLLSASKRVDGATLLRWSSVSENDHELYLVEYSTNGKDFDVIGEVEGNNKPGFNFEYDFLHKATQKGTNYYRLHLVDVDGRQNYSNTKKVVIGYRRQELNIYPNPTMSRTILHLDAPDGENIRVGVYDLSGKELISNNVTLKARSVELNVQDLERGMYSVVVFRESGEQLRSKLLVSF